MQHLRARTIWTVAAASWFGLAAIGAVTAEIAVAAPAPVSVTSVTVGCTLSSQTVVSTTFKNAGSTSHTVGVAFYASSATPPATASATRTVSAGTSAVLSAPDTTAGSGPDFVRAFVDGTPLGASASEFFTCAPTEHKSVTVASGTQSDPVAGCHFETWTTTLAPAHGHLSFLPDAQTETIDVVYTSVAGYRGPDHFQVTCGTVPSPEPTVLVDATVLVTAAPATPVLAQTGSPSRRLVGFAGLLLVAGSVVLLTARATRHRN